MSFISHFRWIIFLCIWSGGFSQALYAVEVEYLYTVEVDVADQSRAARAEAFKDALGKVLIRVTGNREILITDPASSILKTASRFVRQYRYRNDEQPEADIQETDIDEAKLNSKRLWVEFDGRALERALRNADLPIWGQNRPTTLLWLAVQEGRKRYIVGEDSQEEIKQVVNEAIQARGIPVLFPLQDLQERRRIEFADIRAGFSENILAASERYNAETILVGMVTYTNSTQWSARWRVYRDNVASAWNIDNTDVELAIASGVDGAADILATRYAIAGGSQQQSQALKVLVENVASLTAYAKTLNYLNSLTLVEKVMPAQIENGKVRFDILYRGEQKDFERAIALKQLLKPVISNGFDVANGNNGPKQKDSIAADLTYQFNLN